MVKRKKTAKPGGGRAQREIRAQIEQTAREVENLANVLTCPSDVCGETANQCLGEAQEIEQKLLLERLALEIWSPVTAAAAAPIVELFRELVAERERHQQALVSLGQRLGALAGHDLHDHLEPFDDYCKLVLQRLYVEPAERARLTPAPEPSSET